MTIAPDRPAANNRIRLAEKPVRTFHPKPSGKPDPAAHLTAEQIEEFGRKMDALRAEVMDSRNAKDAAYIRRIIAWQRGLEVGSRAVLLFSAWRPAWVIGVAGLSVAKIMENMEIGHNVMHGQWDWMRDPKIHSTMWEWDNASPASLWKHSHNEMHHTYTNVIGKDNDLGFGIARTDEDQRWYPFFLAQPLWSAINACVFEYSIAAYDMQIGKRIAGKSDKKEFNNKLKSVGRKIGNQMAKDYVVHPALSGPNFVHTLTANMAANLVRNLWTNAIILCGHMPEGIETFEKKTINGETRGQWYLRQALGSGNITGGKPMNLMSGNLSHQVEHHLFPDMPSNRYARIAPRVKAIMAEYGLPYVSGSMPRQLASAWGKIFKYALPNGAWKRLRRNPVNGVKYIVAACKDPKSTW